MNSRLLHAAARGARIQNEYHNWTTGGTEWREASLNQLYGARIHPEDEHLQYGPISTGFRAYAYRGESDYPYCYMTVASTDIGAFWMRTDDTISFEGCDNELTRSLFLLILAEALADEGL